MPIRILFPEEGDTLRFETARGAISPRWTGDSSAAYAVEYSVGQGTHHLEGEISVNGSAPKYGSFAEGMWNTLALYNPWRFRVRRADAPSEWSEWRTFFVAAFSKGPSSQPSRTAWVTGALLTLRHGAATHWKIVAIGGAAGAGLLVYILLSDALRRRKRR